MGFEVSLPEVLPELLPGLPEFLPEGLSAVATAPEGGWRRREGQCLAANPWTGIGRACCRRRCRFFADFCRCSDGARCGGADLAGFPALGLGKVRLPVLPGLPT